MTVDLERKHEHFLHEKTAQHLAEELHQLEASVRKAIAAELRELQRAARVKQFLPVLTAKHVKARYRHK